MRQELFEREPGLNAFVIGEVDGDRVAELQQDLAADPAWGPRRRRVSHYDNIGNGLGSRRGNHIPACASLGADSGPIGGVFNVAA